MSFCGWSGGEKYKNHFSDGAVELFHVLICVYDCRSLVRLTFKLTVVYIEQHIFLVYLSILTLKLTYK